MYLYLNYAREHWMKPGENPRVGLILCAKKRHAVARYALDGLPNKIAAAEYLTALPKTTTTVAELEHTREVLEERRRLLATSRADAGAKTVGDRASSPRDV
jgi:YhcG PDDEXK nuclease domain